LRSLSSVTFSPWTAGLFMCGTEEQDPANAAANAIVVGKVDLERGELCLREDGQVAVWAHPLYDHVRLCVVCRGVPCVCVCVGR
jgi:hypothetical protein